MHALKFNVETTVVWVEVRRVVVAGYTGRDVEHVEAHIRELRSYGIPSPPSVPAFYCVSPANLVQERQIRVPSSTVSGEAEAILIFTAGDLESALVAVGSDLTDRKLERHSIEVAKQLPKPISSEAWRYSDVRAVWDELELASWVAPDKEIEYYQRGRLAGLLPPEQVLERLQDRCRESLDGTALLLGTLPLRAGSFSYSDYFACELRAPGRPPLRCEYTMEVDTRQA
jgi:hypothetical protein